ncbi:hypothetical protein EK0264_17145 [Epidermidibacterium keratini]|uniref:Uncharacterized protein n=1 Tax=Epidermidibacterium keratini TaxID=1891644 RepID=A0A7L4YSF9_9ACTN|nr:hypothetical protein [Epidermidibacterium keratini]QHC01834.1 hypothetical protein EK0264_17145 [Epidermidibacterium keratini]
MSESSRRTPNRWWQAASVSVAVLVIGLLGIVLSTVSLLRSPELYRTSSSGELPDFADDPANSWGDYNEGVPEAEPAWTADDFIAAVGDGGPGRIVAMPGAASYLDTAAIEAMIAGSDVLVVVTPPSPLGAIETTRVRDNTVQKYWADERGIRLVMVHGTEAYLPASDNSGLIVGATPDAGIPIRDALVYNDATSAVQHVIDRYRGYESPPSPPVPTSAAELQPAGRAPTDAELAPVVQTLQTGTPYVAPGVAGPVEADLSGLGADVKVAVFDYAAPGQFVDYASALRAAFPGSAVVVVTGSWVQTTGLDEQLSSDVMMQIAAIGGFPLASARPDPTRLLDLFSSAYEVAAAGAAAHSDLPSEPEGLPRWVALLMLGASIVLVLGFFAGSLLEWRGRRKESWQQRRDRLAGQLAERYVAIGAVLSLSLRPDTGVARRQLDAAYSSVLQLRGADKDSVDAIALTAWDSLDAAVREIGEEQLGPSAALSAADRPKPAAPAASPASPAPTSDRVRRRWLPWAIALIAGSYVFLNLFGSVAGSLGLDNRSSAQIDPLASSSVMSTGGDLDIETIRGVVGTRSMMVVYDDSGDSGSRYALGQNVAAAYPKALVFIVADGEIDTAEIGDEAAVDGYDVYALIEDYYPVQYAAGSDPVAQARQLAILYDRLVAEGKINGIDRLQYESQIPWTPVAIGMVLALVVAAFVIRAAIVRLARWRSERDETTGEREALSLRLAETSRQLLHASDPSPGVLAGFARREAALAAEVAAADPSGFAALRARIEAFDDEVGRVVA